MMLVLVRALLEGELVETEELEEVMPKETPFRGVSVFGAAYAELTVTANSTDVVFAGPSLRMAQTIGRATRERVQLFTLVGNDSLGEQLKKGLMEDRVVTTFVGVDNKSPTATTIRLTLPNKVLAQQVNVTVPQKRAKEQTTVVQYNHDTVFKTNYKYMYPNRFFINDSDAIVTDLMINPNAIKQFVGQHGDKLFIDVANNSQRYSDVLYELYNQYARTRKFADAPAVIRGLMLEEAEADKMISALCGRLVILGKNGPKVTKACPTVLKQSLSKLMTGALNEANLSVYMQAMHLLAKTQTLVIKTGRGFLHSMLYNGTLLQAYLAEYPQGVPAGGAAEDFFACYVTGLQKQLSIEKAAGLGMACYSAAAQNNLNPERVEFIADGAGVKNTVVAMSAQDLVRSLKLDGSEEAEEAEKK